MRPDPEKRACRDVAVALAVRAAACPSGMSFCQLERKHCGQRRADRLLSGRRWTTWVSSRFETRLWGLFGPVAEMGAVAKTAVPRSADRGCAGKAFRRELLPGEPQGVYRQAALPSPGDAGGVGGRQRRCLTESARKLTSRWIRYPMRLPDRPGRLRPVSRLTTKTRTPFSFALQNGTVATTFLTKNRGHQPMRGLPKRIMGYAQTLPEATPLCPGALLHLGRRAAVDQGPCRVSLARGN